MPTSRRGTYALIAAAALWAQLVVIPTALAWTHGRGPDVFSLLAALLAPAVAAAGVLVSDRRRDVGIGLVLAGFPTALGIFGVVAGRLELARFDAAARVIAAATGVGFVVATIYWSDSTVQRVPVTVAAADAPSTVRPPPPPLRVPAFFAIAVAAAFVGIVAPALVTANGVLTRAERLGGEPLTRARETMTESAALALALALVLGAGSTLLRGRTTRRRRGARALAFLVWGVAVAALIELLMGSHFFWTGWR